MGTADLCLGKLREDIVLVCQPAAFPPRITACKCSMPQDDIIEALIFGMQQLDKAPINPSSRIASRCSNSSSGLHNRHFPIPGQPKAAAHLHTIVLSPDSTRHNDPDGMDPGFPAR